MNKIMMDKQSHFINKTDVNSIGIPLEGGGVFIEDPHLTEIFSIVSKRMFELEKRVDAISNAK